MSRYLFVAFALALGTAPAAAHFLYLIPGGAEGGFQAVYNDAPTPDEAVSGELFPNAVFQCVDASGTAANAAIKPGKGGLPRIEGEASAAYGSVLYGVVFRGETSPVLIVYHPKTVKAVPGEAKPVGLPLELTPMVADGKLAFVATEKGVPTAGLAVMVYRPGDAKPTVVKTNAAGRTPGFDKAGDYGARAYRANAVGGEHQGRRYAGERHYATLTVKYEPLSR